MKRVLAILCCLAMVCGLVGCSGSGTASASPSASASTSGAYTAGTYTGTGHGHNGDVLMDVTFTDNAIESITVKEQAETPNLSDKAFTEIPEAIIQYQSLGIDTLAGATFSSRAVINAVADAVDQAGGDSAALKEVPVELPALATEDLTADVLVIGGGTAGLMAAYTAALGGQKVILVEKEDIIGGTLNVAAGLLLTVTSEKNDPSIDDSAARVEEFFQSINGDSAVQPDYEYTFLLMEQTGATVDELIDMGMEHTDLDMGNYAGTIFTAGSKLAGDLLKACEDKGVTVLTGTSADALIQAEDGTVTGATVTNRSGSYTITAKATIVAAGGASYSQDLKDAEASLATVDLNEKTAVGSTADGFHLLATAGAQMSDTLYVKSSQPDFAAVFKTNWSNTPSTAMTIMIDAQGERFANEAPAADTILNKHMLDHASSAYWNLIDENNTIGFDPDLFEAIKTESSSDDVKVAVYGATLEELATKLGVDSATLQATVDTYNAGCEAGNDAFGKDAASCIAYPSEGGYYAAYRRIGSWGTIGGAIVDNQQHVLDASGAVIPGLYAAGESATGQIFGDYYFGGFSLGLYTTAGRIAAETAVNEIK